ncbi:MAG: hypothetical protein GDA43_20045 [Hormoscilla sp. SP5CHS1]|nr:hypothetical protein [Hormoscilla sp. SP12CHS1]MBC6455207.1 hypothetical protein [Hormoscilla sp. SP5CHS1]
MQELSGAGGNWRVIDEAIDPTVVQQQDSLSCGPACGEMLLRDRGVNDVDQSIIAYETGVPVDVAYLARVLNQIDRSDIGLWRGGNFVSDDMSAMLDRLIAKGSWAAEMKEFGNPIAHLVVVDGCDALGFVKIRDPWNQTKYKMEKEEFLNYWTTRVIYLEPNS